MNKLIEIIPSGKYPKVQWKKKTKAKPKNTKTFLEKNFNKREMELEVIYDGK